MAEDDIYRSKARYEKFKENLESYLVKPTEEKKIGKRRYYIRNRKNLKYFYRLIDKFEAKDNSFIRRLTVLGNMKIIVCSTDKDLKDCDREDIDKIVAFMHTNLKSITSKVDFIKNIRYIWKNLFPEKDEKGRIDEGIVSYPVRHLSARIDKSKEKLRDDRLSMEEFDEFVNYFSKDVVMKSYLTFALESLGRPQEILHRKIKDLQIFENYAKIYISEHGKEGTGFLICIDSFPYLMKMYEQHPFKNDPEAYLFLNEKHKQLKPFALNKRIKIALRNLEINKSVTCYSLKRNGVTFRRLRGDSDTEIQHVARWTTTKQLHTYDLSVQEDTLKIELARKGLTIGRTDYRNICFDLDKEIFVARRADDIRFISFADFFGDNHLKIYDSLKDENRKKIFHRCRDKFSNYPFSIIIVKDKNIEQVCEIFERLNQGGKKLDLFDLVVANTWDKEFKLKEEIAELNKVFKNSFGAIKNEVFIQSISLIKKKQCNRAHQLRLTKEDFKETWKDFSEALKKAIDFLKNNLGAKTADIIPYASIIPLVVYFYYHSKTMSNKQKEKIEEWFWKVSFSERYSASSLTRMGEDRNIFDKLLNEEEASINFPISITLDKINRTNITSRSALRNAILCVLVKRNPTNFKDNSSITLDKDYFSTLKSPEKHHIFPKKFLSDQGISNVNCISNLCFIPSSLNKEISKDKPSHYFLEYKKLNSRFEDSLKTHLIPFSKDSGIWDDNYESFIDKRANMFMKEISRFVGEMTPIEKELEESPEKVLNLTENQIREMIHTNLYEYYGESYWRDQIPLDIQDQVNKRVKDLLKRQPFLKEASEEPQKKLELCDMMDYPKIILKNWKVFVDYFGSKEQLDKHFKHLKEYRNAIAHSKEMSSITKKEGEIAIEWLSEVLKNDEILEENNNGEDGGDNELYERLKEKILEFNDEIVVEPKKYYVAFKIGNRNFLEAIMRKDKIVLYLKGEGFDDPNNILKDVYEKEHHGTGCYETSLVSISELSYILDLVKQAFNSIKKKVKD
jgi:predicted transport protein